ncbi:MAG TPA: mechanosensitive ion channel domain-containing protein [Thermomicrobiales bacterium]|nr:mechanosensitive ion channel domain-containing protein [Thermomicrobiales bacterium]
MRKALTGTLEKLLDLVLRIGEIGLSVAIIFAIAIGISWFARRQIEPLLSRRSFGRNGALLIGRIISVLAFVIAGIVSLARLGVNTTGLFAFLSAFTVAIGLSLQDVMKNFFAGILLLLERPFSVGDRVKVRDVEGEIQGIDIRTTLVRNLEGSLVLVPNSIMFTEILTNRSHYRTRRLDLKITVVSEPVDVVERRVVESLGEIQGVRKPIPAPTIKSVSSSAQILEMSLLIESRAGIDQEVMKALIGKLGDSTIEIGAAS